MRWLTSHSTGPVAASRARPVNSDVRPMKNPLLNKCPVCRSTDLSPPMGLMPLLYTTKPITCNACKAMFEPNIISRIGLWLFITLLFTLVFVQRYLIKLLGKDASLTIILSFLGLFFLLVIVGAIAEFFKPWQFTIWDNRNLRRAIINYGAIASFVLYGIAFYSLRDSWLKEAPGPNPSYMDSPGKQEIDR